MANPTWDETEEIKHSAAAPSWDDTEPVSESGGKSIAGFAGNAVQDTGEIIGSLANLTGEMISHPIDTTSQVVKGLPGAVKSWSGEVGLTKALHGDLPGAGKQFVESAYQKPVSRALDVAAIAMPALKATGVLKTAELGAEGGRIANLAKEGSNALGRREMGFTKRFLNTTAKDVAADNTVEWANKHPGDLMNVMDSPSDRLKRVQGVQKQSWDKMAETYKNPALQGKSMDAKQLMESVDQMRPRDAKGNVLRGGEYDTLNAEIDKKIDTIKAFGGKRTVPAAKSDFLLDVNGQPKTMGSPRVEEIQPNIPWEDAQGLKNTMKQSTKWELTQPSTINDLRKRISGGFRENMDSQLAREIGEEGMADYTAAKHDYGMSKKAIRALENKISSEKGNRLVGLTDMIGGGAGYAHGGPLVGMAVVAGKKIIERYGMAAGSKLLSKVASGKYAAAIERAAVKGPAELAVTLDLIANKDPQFAQEVGSLQ